MKAAVLGSADCLADDLMRLADLGPWDGLVVVVNETGVFYPHDIDVWVTMHGEKLDWWRSHRTGNDDHEAIVAPECGGSSGAAAVLEALKLADKVVLCGMPMDKRPHLRRPGGWLPADSHHGWWEQNKDQLVNVRSMSGWTRELLGAPTKEWL